MHSFGFGKVRVKAHIALHVPFGSGWVDVAAVTPIISLSIPSGKSFFFFSFPNHTSHFFIYILYSTSARSLLQLIHGCFLRLCV